MQAKRCPQLSQRELVEDLYSRKFECITRLAYHKDQHQCGDWLLSAKYFFPATPWDSVLYEVRVAARNIFDRRRWKGSAALVLAKQAGEAVREQQLRKAEKKAKKSRKSKKSVEQPKKVCYRIREISEYNEPRMIRWSQDECLLRTEPPLEDEEFFELAMSSNVCIKSPYNQRSLMNCLSRNQVKLLRNFPQSLKSGIKNYWNNKKFVVRNYRPDEALLRWAVRTVGRNWQVVASVLANHPLGSGQMWTYTDAYWRYNALITAENPRTYKGMNPDPECESVPVLGRFRTRLTQDIASLKDIYENKEHTWDNKHHSYNKHKEDNGQNVHKRKVPEASFSNHNAIAYIGEKKIKLEDENSKDLIAATHQEENATTKENAKATSSGNQDTCLHKPLIGFSEASYTPCATISENKPSHELCANSNENLTIADESSGIQYNQSKDEANSKSSIKNNSDESAPLSKGNLFNDISNKVSESTISNKDGMMPSTSNELINKSVKSDFANVLSQCNDELSTTIDSTACNTSNENTAKCNNTGYEEISKSCSVNSGSKTQGSVAVLPQHEEVSRNPINMESGTDAFDERMRTGEAIVIDDEVRLNPDITNLGGANVKLRRELMDLEEGVLTFNQSASKNEEGAHDFYKNIDRKLEDTTAYLENSERNVELERKIGEGVFNFPKDSNQSLKEQRHTNDELSRYDTDIEADKDYIQSEKVELAELNEYNYNTSHENRNKLYDNPNIKSAFDLKPEPRSEFIQYRYKSNYFNPSKYKEARTSVPVKALAKIFSQSGILRIDLQKRRTNTLRSLLHFDSIPEPPKVKPQSFPELPPLKSIEIKKSSNVMSWKELVCRKPSVNELLVRREGFEMDKSGPIAMVKGFPSVVEKGKGRKRGRKRKEEAKEEDKPKKRKYRKRNNETEPVPTV